MNLFKRKSKLEECEEMIRILKAHNQMPNMVGRDWYNKETLYSGDGTPEDDLITLNSKVSITGKKINTIIQGPWHQVQPKGPGFPIKDEVLQYSAIPIHGTRFAWCRIIKDQLYDTLEGPGLITKKDKLVSLAKKDNVNINVDEEGVVQYVLPNNKYGVTFKSGDKTLDLTECKVDYFTNRNRLNRKDQKLAVGDKVTGYVQFKVYGRLYWYFIAEFKNGIVKLPCQYYETDFDSNWCESPLYDPEIIHSVLDDKLRTFYLENNNIDRYIETVPKEPQMRNLSDSEIRLKLMQYQKMVHADCTKVMNTTVFHKAKKTIGGEMTLTDYDKSLGFEKPQAITKHDFDLMANEFKCTTLIVAHNCVEVMKYCKKYVFDDEKKTYLGNIKCEDQIYNDLKELYEYQVETLMSEVMQWCGQPEKMKKAGPEIPIKQEQVYNDMYDYMEDSHRPYMEIAEEILFELENNGEMPMNGLNALQSIEELVEDLLNDEITEDDFNTAAIRSQSNVQAMVFLMNTGQMPDVENPLNQVDDRIASNWPFNPDIVHGEETLEFTEILEDRTVFADDEPDRNRTIKNSILQALFATLVTHWYRTYYWVVTNPIKKIGEYYTLMPGNGWQMRLIVNIASMNTPLPIVSNRFTSWLVDKRLTNRPIHFTTSNTVFGSVNMTESGLMTQDGLGNIVNETLLDGMTRYSSTAMQATKFVGWLDNSEDQRTLAQYSRNFDDMDQLQIENFMETEYIETFSAHLGKAASRLFESVVNPGIGQGDLTSNLKNTKEAITYNVQHAVLQITKAEIKMWLDMYWVWHLFILGAFSAVTIRKLLPKKASKWTDVGSLYLPHVLMPLGSQVGNLLTNGVKASVIPNLIIESRKNLMLGALYTYTYALCELVDNTVKNDDLVVRYLTPTNRNKWVDWVMNKVTLRWKDNFVQRIDGTNAGEHIWFNTTSPLERLPSIVRNVSNTLKRNLHYPPGTCVKIEDEYMVVVDDLGAMYVNKKCTQDFLDLHGELKKDLNLGNRFRQFVNRLPFLGSKLRLAYNFRTHSVHVISVASQNMVQSLKGTLTLMHVAMMCSGYTNSTKVTAILGAAALEEQQLRLPSLFGAIAGLGGEWLYSESELETREFMFAALTSIAGVGTYQAMSYLNKFPSIAAKSRIFNNQYRDVLIPLHMEMIESSEDSHKWTGILWSPVHGKKYYFDNRVNSDFGDGPSVFGWFITRWNDEGTDLLMIFQGTVNEDFTIEYRYKRSPLLYHVWFVKDN